MRHYSKHRVDIIVKALRKVRAYCAGMNDCRKCAFWDYWGIECKLGSCPADWCLDDIGDFDADTSEKGV